MNGILFGIGILAFVIFAIHEARKWNDSYKQFQRPWKYEETDHGNN